MSDKSAEMEASLYPDEVPSMMWQAGDGLIFDGLRFQRIAPSMETYAMLNMKKKIDDVNMPEKVELVAKSMFYSLQPHIEFNSGYSVTWDSIIEYGRDCYIRMAQAAINAMHQPTMTVEDAVEIMAKAKYCENVAPQFLDEVWRNAPDDDQPWEDSDGYTGSTSGRDSYRKVARTHCRALASAGVLNLKEETNTYGLSVDGAEITSVTIETSGDK